jgi:hypothetical protein
MPKTKENSNIDPFPLCRFPWMNDIQHVRLSACAKHTADSRTISDLIKSPREQSHMPAAASQRSWTRTPTHQTSTYSFPHLTIPCIPRRHEDRFRTATPISPDCLPEDISIHLDSYLYETHHNGEPGAAYPCERSACFRESPREFDDFYYARARYTRQLECEGFELGEVETLGRLAALVRDRLPLDSLQLPGQCKESRRALRYTSQVRADDNSLDNLRGQHLQQTVLCHLPQHGLLHHPPHTDPDPQSPGSTGGTRKMAGSVPRRTATQILPRPPSAGRIAVREICARVAVRRGTRRVTTTIARRRRSDRIGRNRAS